MIQPTVSSHIDVRLIEKALALTGRKLDYTMREMKVDEYGAFDDISMSKFCYYLLSPEFIEKYTYDFSDVDENWNATKFGKAIYEYQKGNPADLISLLEKI